MDPPFPSEGIWQAALERGRVQPGRHFRVSKMSFKRVPKRMLKELLKCTKSKQNATREASRIEIEKRNKKVWKKDPFRP